MDEGALDELLKEADKDGDGAIDYKEFAALVLHDWPASRARN